MRPAAETCSRLGSARCIAATHQWNGNFRFRGSGTGARCVDLDSQDGWKAAFGCLMTVVRVYDRQQPEFESVDYISEYHLWKIQPQRFLRTRVLFGSSSIPFAPCLTWRSEGGGPSP